MTYRYIPKDWVFSQVTGDIAVKVSPVFMPQYSDPLSKQFVWTYNVLIENNSPHKIKLMSRHWEITDGMGRIEEVHGPGVLGEQPVIEPGDTFLYASQAVLPTPTGFMKGDYQVVDEDGSQRRIAVPAFSLDEPTQQPLLN